MAKAAPPTVPRGTARAQVIAQCSQRGNPEGIISLDRTITAPLSFSGRMAAVYATGDIYKPKEVETLT
jgi:hypothetical protein